MRACGSGEDRAPSFEDAGTSNDAGTSTADAGTSDAGGSDAGDSDVTGDAGAPPDADGGPVGPAPTYAPGRVTAHRLNRAEYENSVGDLLGIRVDVADTLPPDDLGYGFDNNADVLSLSVLHLERYEALAGELIERALNPPRAYMVDEVIRARRRGDGRGRRAWRVEPVVQWLAERAGVVGGRWPLRDWL